MVYLPAPSWAAIAAWCAALALVPYLGGGRRWIRGTALACLGLAIGLSVWPWVRPSDGRLRVTFLDVGQGDSILVELPEGPRLLVDGGPAGGNRLDVGERVLAPFLWNRPAARLDAVALSHPDSDHSGGLRAVLTRFRVREFWENGRWISGTEDTLRARGALRRLPAHPRGGAAALARVGAAHRPQPRRDASTGRAAALWTERGVAGAAARLARVSLLLTGDLGAPGEEHLLASRAPVRSLVLKVGHHGSRYSSTGDFLEATRALLAVISVGARNSFGHPTPEALGRLEAAQARIYRTDRDGAVMLETDGRTLWITRWASGAVDRFDLDPEREP